VLDAILKTKKRELAEARERRPLAELRAACRDLPPPRDFTGAVAPPLPSAGVAGPRIVAAPPDGAVRIALIAEIKRASPSRGDLRPDLDPAALARSYASAGARALSVLTDRTFFRGSADDLRAARGASGLPALRKDFTTDPYHVWDARAMGADAVLLIARILSRQQLQDLAGLAGDLGLAALFEVHREDELPAVLDCRPRLVGVNNRDLDTLAVTLDLCERLGRALPPDIGRIAESGIATREDVERIAACGYNAALVGETLVKSADPAAMIRSLLGVKPPDPTTIAEARADTLRSLPPLDEALRPRGDDAPDPGSDASG
jgi:indole-3-glycerol phosphate synthase